MQIFLDSDNVESACQQYDVPDPQQDTRPVSAKQMARCQAMMAHADAASSPDNHSFKFSHINMGANYQQVSAEGALHSLMPDRG